MGLRVEVLAGAPGPRGRAEAGVDDEVAKENFDNKGAVVMGRTMFDLGEIPWGENPPYHNPVFVVTSRPKETVVKQGGTSYTFVPDFDTAMDRAREAAGDRDISIAGGANVVQQAIAAGVLDEIDVHIAPRFLGGGTRLFDNLDPGGKVRDRPGDRLAGDHPRQVPDSEAPGPYIVGRMIPKGSPPVTSRRSARGARCPAWWRPTIWGPTS